jgi:peptide/nickel transport system permease protein
MAAVISTPITETRRPSAISRFFRHRLAIIGCSIILLLCLASAVGPYLLPFTDLQIDIRHRFAAPFQSIHFFGTDQLGRDLLARLLTAGRVSLSIGVAAMVISTIIGVTLGAIAGYYGKVVGAVIMRFVDAMLCFPSVFLLLTLAAFIQPSVPMIILIIATTSWMEIARQVHTQINSLKRRDYAVAAQLLGASDRYIIFRELLPNAVGPIVVAATLTVARAILMESYMSYLGYGVQPPFPSWGNMLNNSQQYLTTSPWLAIFPGLMITAAVTSFNFLGDGLRDVLDPKID